MEQKTSKQVIEELLMPVEGLNIIDVGCGDGALARMLTRRGAHVTGVEVSPRALVRARSVPPVGDETYIQGLAEDLPSKSRSADVVIFFNSFHHVDGVQWPKALKEAARVLVNGGILYVSEPLAEGPYFELMKPAHDETVVRRRALEALRHAPDVGFVQEKVVSHLDIVTFPDFEAFHDRITAINPETRTAFMEHEPEIRANFERLGQRSEEGWSFRQPTRVFLFRRS
ncbi:MAG: class I SAM-dependent methyltransferase [Rhodospirillales bacterium]|nr:MAG: class I SAM-dependent methyltransferase [Rhodospirillales bacterium]